MDDYHADILAIAELHRHAIAVCALLAGFTMVSAYTAKRDEAAGVGFDAAPLLNFASMAFISTVCVSSVYLMAFARYEYLYQDHRELADIVERNGIFETLFAINLSTGSLGMLALLVVMGNIGFTKGRMQGYFTASIALGVFGIMLYALWVFFSSPIIVSP